MKSDSYRKDVLGESRSPHGERGLKYAQAGALPLNAGSLPTRGAWIEIL